MVNMSVWESVEALRAFVYGDAHAAVLRRRREWFERLGEPETALWWVPAGRMPTVAEAEERLATLRARGPGATPSRSARRSGAAGRGPRSGSARRSRAQAAPARAASAPSVADARADLIQARDPEDLEPLADPPSASAAPPGRAPRSRRSRAGRRRPATGQRPAADGVVEAGPHARVAHAGQRQRLVDRRHHARGGRAGRPASGKGWRSPRRGDDERPGRLRARGRAASRWCTRNIRPATASKARRR